MFGSIGTSPKNVGWQNHPNPLGDMEIDDEAIERESQGAQELDLISERLSALEDSDGRESLQTAERVFELRVAVELAQFILHSSGAVDPDRLSMAAEWTEELLERRQINARDSQLLYGLNMLKTSQDLKESIFRVHAPSQSLSLGSAVIRTTLNLDRDAHLTDQHTRQVVLSALLTRHPQGASGSSFVGGLCTELITCDLKRCVRDWISLLTNDGIVRLIDNQQVLVPIQQSWHQTDSHRYFTITSTGLKRDKRPLVKDPGVQAVRQSLGFSEAVFEGLFSNAVRQVFAESERNASSYRPVTDTTTTLAQLIELLAVELQKADRIKLEEVPTTVRKMLYTFEARTHHPLLMAWENCLANMSEAEGKPSGPTKNRLVEAVTAAARKTLERAVDKADRRTEHFKIDEFVSGVKRFLVERGQYLCTTTYAEDPGSRSQKPRMCTAFVLYDREGFLAAGRWQRLDTLRSFQIFLQEAVTSAREVLDHSALSGSDLTEVTRAYQELGEEVLKSSFMDSVLKIYRDDRVTDVDALPAVGEPPPSPWADLRPGSLNRTLKVYFELGSSPKPLSLKARSGEQLLTHLIERLRALSVGSQSILLNNSYVRSPVRTTGPRAFAFRFSSQTLLNACKHAGYVREWIEKQMVEPGRAVSQTRVTADYKRLVIEYCHQNLEDSRDRLTFTDHAQKLPIDIWLSDFRDRIVSILDRLGLTSPDFVALDSAMFARLDPQISMQLKQRSITFADQNLLSGPNGVQFVFMYNPFQCRLEIWQIGRDGTVSAMDQSGWMNDRSWANHISVLELMN